MILEKEVNAILANAILKEERGVAASKYGKVVDEVMKYCSGFIATTPKNPVDKYDYIITIPKEITQKFDFIEDLDLVIYLEPLENPTYSGGGNTQFDKTKHFTDLGSEKLPPVSVQIYGSYGNAGISRRSVMNSLYHELNHCYDAWARKEQWKKDDMLNDIITGYNEKKKTQFSPRQDVNNYFSQLFYRLFIPTEFNAMCSGVYGDLKGFDSDRVNFREDIKKTQAWYFLTAFAENFDAAVEGASIETLMDACRRMKIDGISRQDPHTFMVTFKNVVEKKIREGWKSVGRAASIWYDDKEDMENNKNDIINVQ